MKIIFHRGGKEIGGNCIEIQSGNEKILLDIGKPITNKDLEGCILEGSFYDGVLLSHIHIDHYGLLNRLSKDTKVFCSAAAKDILDVNQIFLRQDHYSFNFNVFESYKSFNIGSFEIIPFLQDHSAFDSHGFLIRAEGKTIIYTGDFRNHGRKPYVYKKLLNLIKNEKISLLITEGTTLKRECEMVKTEDEIADDLTSAISNVTGLVMICFSPQNIDRLVSIYKSARKTGRIFIIDIYTAYLLSILSNYTKIPTANFRNMNVYYPKNQIKKLLKMNMSDILEGFRSRRIFPDKIKADPEKYIMLIRPSMVDELDDLEVSLLIYSMWQGYLKNEDMNKMKEWCINKNAQFKSIHTSGHMSVDFFIEFIEKINPEIIKIIHTEGINEAYPQLKKYENDIADNGDVLII